MIITINDNLTSVVTSDDNLLECLLPNYNPETLKPFSSKEDVQVFARTIEINLNYFNRKLTPEEKALAADLKFSTDKAAFILQIDTDVDALIRAVIGERTSEYELAEKEATAYKAAGYTGTVPDSVSAWATAKSWKPKVAADSIIATAAAWRSAQASMRATRLLSKEQARVTVDVAALDAIKVQWDEFMVALKLQLNV